MKDQQSCAEKLFLLGEMLDTANQYLQQCEKAADRDEAAMVSLAADEIVAIRVRCAQLGTDLARLQKRLQKHSAKTAQAGTT